MVLWFVVVGKANSNWGICSLLGEINLVAGLLERWWLHWGKSSRIIEVDSIGERFSEVKLLLGNYPMRRTLGRLVISPRSKCLWYCQKCLIVRNLFVEIDVQCPKWQRWRPASGYSSFLEKFPGILTWQPQVCWIATCHAPLLIGDFVIGSFIPSEVTLFTERAFVHRIFAVWISLLSNK